MIVGLVGFAAAWIHRTVARRDVLPWAFAAGAWIAGAVDLVRFHWQVAPALALLTGFLIALAVRRARRKRHPEAPTTSSWAPRVAIVLTVAASVSPLFLYPIFRLPNPDGAYNIGVREFELTDLSRTGVLFAGKNEPRKLLVSVWYPASDATHESVRPYLTRQEVLDQGISLAANFRRPWFLYLHFSLVRTHSHQGAQIAQGDEIFPMVVFSHGFWSYPSQNTVLFERLASHGYIVFSLAHPYDSVTLRFQNGDTVPTGLGGRGDPVALAEAIARVAGGETHDDRTDALSDLGTAVDAHRLGDSLRAWRDDTLFLLKQINSREVPQPIAELLQRASLERLGLIGMSFGGSTSATVCQLEPKCRAVINIDGQNFDAALFNADLRAALLMIHSDWVEYPVLRRQKQDPRFNPNDYAYESWSHAGERSDIVRLRIPGVRHMGLTDLTMSANGWAAEAQYGIASGKRVIDIVNDLALAFLETHLKGREVGFPRAQFARHPEIIRHDASDVRKWRSNSAQTTNK